MLELWLMLSTPLLLSFSGQLWSGMIAPDRVLSMGQKEQNRVLMLNWIVQYRIVYMYKKGFWH